MKNFFTEGWLVLVLLSVGLNVSDQSAQTPTPNTGNGYDGDPLFSWNQGKVKNSVIDFVKRVTKEGSVDFIPVEDRMPHSAMMVRYRQNNLLCKSCIWFAG